MLGKGTMARETSMCLLSLDDWLDQCIRETKGPPERRRSQSEEEGVSDPQSPERHPEWKTRILKVEPFTGCDMSDDGLDPDVQFGEGGSLACDLPGFLQICHLLHGTARVHSHDPEQEENE